MNELLQKHGCANVFTVPDGLKELMSDITREVLRAQPPNILEFIANYLSVLLITREHGIMAMKILDDLCDCRPSVSEHLIQLGLQPGEAHILSGIIKEEIEGFQPTNDKLTIKEYQIMKKILLRNPLDEVMAAKVCQVARNAFRDYCYRKETLEKSLKIKPKEPWEIAAQRTLELYKRTKPSLSELTRATEKIQAAYRGYHVRRNLLRHLKPKSKRKGPKLDLPGPPLDIASSREIDLGPLLNIKVREDDVRSMFDEHRTKKLGLQYDPMRTITHIPDEEYVEEGDPLSRDRYSRDIQIEKRRSRAPSIAPSQMSEGKRHSRFVSQIDAREDQIYPETNVQKISFSEFPPEVIASEDIEGGDEVKELLTAETVESEGMDVSEDIPDEYTEADEESAPETIPSSAPDTANTTDVEDEAGAGQNTTDEEEG